MDYFQYLKNGDEIVVEGEVLNLIINGLLSIFPSLRYLLLLLLVLNLIINGLLSILYSAIIAIICCYDVVLNLIINGLLSIFCAVYEHKVLFLNGF